MPNKNLDKTDLKILEILQSDSRVMTSQLSERLNLSTSPCWRRVKRLEETKIIQGYGVFLDRRKLNLSVMVFIRVSIDSHSEKEARKFEEEVIALDNVVACYSMGGDADFLLQIVSSNLDTYADFSMFVIRRLPGIKEMQSMFVLKEIKPFKGFPLI
ncbi:Lrp/AsnC family transcriptional regulator [Acinetobacter pollinis]|uniref:Lrp/AsnC family transcriptional regulator n=1 Tax=Acinetobacter pollinis TaxID=2605270 RepID=UPI0018A32A05|nr:Lrp/AsnC family transcriptional regulator [Acinetobacter pollinis]MBF7691323.1 Lrp/AsnC family transcriptional regulator [Acinetobacter pollinis]MBF7693785.1 Lrp/AsnC family transcriptional regulator [Acinetobacter pollinis]MBF7698454.1 Lrp/AsnC family transcriptional regulator [Acinetobacter pollinis]MBF7701415.1 Lrp/AsnC family transcriptional regulator [Acinetobacter pollinis]